MAIKNPIHKGSRFLSDYLVASEVVKGSSVQALVSPNTEPNTLAVKRCYNTKSEGFHDAPLSTPISKAVAA